MNGSVNKNCGGSGINNQSLAAEGVVERGSCLLLRYASQNSLDESSQNKQQRSSKDKTTGSYRSDIHTMECFKTMNKMRIERLFCDVTLIVEDVEIPAHKMVLSACSPYFYAMFASSEFEESRRDKITIQGIDSEALKLLVEYVYTSCVDVTEDNVQALLNAANLLQLTDVRDACCDYLQSQLHPSNCLGIRDFAEMHGCSQLVTAAWNYIEKYFFKVIQYDEFLNLQPEQMAAILQNDRITVSSEEKVYESVIAWVQFDSHTRREYLPMLLEHVRLPLVAQDYLVSRVENEPLLKEDLNCKDFIIEAFKYHLLKNDGKNTFNSVRTIPRHCTRVPKVLLVIGGQAPKAIRSVECYDLAEEMWYQAAEMPSRRCRAGLAVLNDKVYAVGGFNGNLRVRTVDVYDPAKDSWSTCTSMEARRSTLGVAVLNGLIYAVGGFDGVNGLSSAEVYDPKRETWNMIESMSTRRSSVGVGVVHNKIYAVGGYDGNRRQCLNSVERYNTETNEWEEITNMTERRSGAGVGVVDNVLFAIGGHDGPLVRKSCEKYDADTDTWTPIADMNYRRRNAGVVSLEGALFVVGGDDGSTNLSNVEVYCMETDTWRVLTANMTVGRSYAGVCFIEKPL